MWVSTVALDFTIYSQVYILMAHYLSPHAHLVVNMYVHNTFIYTLCADSQPSDSLLFCPLVYPIWCVLFLDFVTSRVLSGPGPLNSAKAKASALRPLDSSD